MTSNSAKGRFRFSLRTLFVVVTVVAVFAGLLRTFPIAMLEIVVALVIACGAMLGGLLFSLLLVFALDGIFRMVGRLRAILRPSPPATH